MSIIEWALNAPDVPKEKWDEFSKIFEKSEALKPAFTGRVRPFWWKGGMVFIGTEFDDDLAKIGILENKGYK